MELENVNPDGNNIVASNLTPKIPWDQKLVDCYFGSLCEEFIFFQFFLWDEWTTYFTSFP
jgi:hypothetical protein